MVRKRDITVEYFPSNGLWEFTITGGLVPVKGCNFRNKREAKREVNKILKHFDATRIAHVNRIPKNFKRAGTITP